MTAPAIVPDHPCHAEACTVEIDPSRLMCPRHWRMVSPGLQRAVWRHYVPGQEVTKTPSAAYLAAAQAAIDDVARKEGRR